METIGQPVEGVVFLWVVEIENVMSVEYDLTDRRPFRRGSEVGRRSVVRQRAGGREYQEETKIAYRTDTVVVPQVETVYSTLVFTEDEHVTVTETDHFTQTQAQQYPVEVTVTSVQQIPQVRRKTLQY